MIAALVVLTVLSATDKAADKAADGPTTSPLANDVDPAVRIQALEDDVRALQKRVEGLEKRLSGPPPEAPQEAAFDIPAGTSPTLGSGPIDLVVFTDFQCPFCARAHPVVTDVVTSEQLKGKVRLVYKYYPLSFHINAKPAALMSMAVRDLGGDAAFWKFVALCYDHQQALTANDLAAYAKDAGVSAAKAQVLLVQNGRRYEAVLEGDRKLAEKIKVRGTPQLYVGGWELKVRSLDGVLSLIQEKKL